jgi:hypothetical protein
MLRPIGGHCEREAQSAAQAAAYPTLEICARKYRPRKPLDNVYAVANSLSLVARAQGARSDLLAFGLRLSRLLPNCGQGNQGADFAFLLVGSPTQTIRRECQKFNDLARTRRLNSHPLHPDSAREKSRERGHKHQPRRLRTGTKVWLPELPSWGAVLLRKSMRGLSLAAVCAVAIIYSQPCSAQTFGALNLGLEGFEVRSLSPERATPSIAQWLLTLPEPDNWRAQNAAGDDIHSMLAAEPIGGEIYHLTAFRQPAPAVADLGLASDNRPLDTAPIGGNARHFETPNGARSQALADSVPVRRRKPALEGRSVYKRVSQHSGPGRRGRSATNAQHCICTKAAAGMGPAINTRGYPTFSSESGSATLNRFIGMSLLPW